MSRLLVPGARREHEECLSLASLFNKLNMIDALEVLVVRELPHNALFGVELEDLGRGSEVAVAEPVHDHRVPIRLAFHRTCEVERVVGNFVAPDAPDNLA